MASGVISSITFTPSADGVLSLTVTGQAQGTSGGDWGSSIYIRGFADQGTPDYGDQIRVASGSRLPFALTHQVDVLGGVEVDVGIYGEISGAVSVACWDVKIDAVVIKR